MGLGKCFWDAVKPVARFQSLDSLRGKALAIDLSFWMIQLLSSVKSIPLRKPHLRLLFFRTLHLVAKIGVFPVFVADGDPPPLKLQVRLDRFSRISGIHWNSLDGGADNNRGRNSRFMENIKECVELLELLGLPVLRAKHEAEGLCAQLEKEGFVHACLTPDSDVFLYGARHVIKILQPDRKDPHMESYMMKDIESSLGLHREHLVALALLVGCDYNVHGVSGIGCQNAIRLIKEVPQQQIFDRLRDWGSGKLESESEMRGSESGLRNGYNIQNEKAEGDKRNVHKKLHCSFCGHPGTKKQHNKLGCEDCKLNHGSDGSADEQGCKSKDQGFTCTCQSCEDRKVTRRRAKQTSWKSKMCDKISATEEFPNEEIIQIFMNPEHEILGIDGTAQISPAWEHPKLDALESFLEWHLHWDKIYVRQKMLPLLSYYCLRDRASIWRLGKSDSINPTINGLYVPHSIQRIKISFSKPLYRLCWKLTKDSKFEDDWLGLKCFDACGDEEPLDEADVLVSDLQTESLDDSLMFTTDEDMTLLKEACPDIVSRFEKEQIEKKSLKRGNSRRKKIQDTCPKEQLSITSFFKSKKEGYVADVKNPCPTSCPAEVSESIISYLDGKVAQSQVQRHVNLAMNQCTKTVEIKMEENDATSKAEIPRILVKEYDEKDTWGDKHENKPEENGLVCGKGVAGYVSEIPSVIHIDVEEPCKASKLGEHSPRYQMSKKCFFSCRETPSNEASQCMCDTIHVGAATTPETCLNIPNLETNKIESLVSENSHRSTPRRILF